MTREISPQMSAELSRRAGHYAIAVAECLLEAGLPVTGIQSCGPWRDTDGEYLDVEAAISFTQAFQDRCGAASIRRVLSRRPSALSSVLNAKPGFGYGT
ncbi:hypothetical protein AB0M86_33705 [Streptomyces sp. NPDC051639]|uniref:hypothetical protein n=2 Tax=unclassified Streptomyces TaxID=2593676 RepID=UPI0034277E4A